MASLQDKIYMKQATELAKRGAGFVNPNPLVGAVIVKDGKAGTQNTVSFMRKETLSQALKIRKTQKVQQFMSHLNRVAITEKLRLVRKRLSNMG